jgi:predicted DNA-binding transcriptional regulator AlpA
MSKSDLSLSNNLGDVQLLTVKQVAKLLGFHERTCWKMAVMGEIPKPIKIGSKAQRWRMNDLKSFIQGGGL